MSAVLNRTTFSTSRLLEFCSQKELTAQTGHEPADWPLVVAKELVDNALDNAEESGVQPVIRITIARGKVRVTDNGSGIPPETVASILDFTTRTSSREAYVAPDRGAQGNALKTVLAMPFALGDGEEGHVEIVARGVRHRIAFRVDQIRQAPVLDHQTEAAPVRNGTAVTVHWPASSTELEDVKPRFLQIAETLAFLNPHLALSVVWRDDDPYNNHVRLTWPATRPAWQKWTPATPTSAHWYRREDLERLIGAYIAHDRERGRTQTVSEFVAEFAGLSGTAKRKAVTDVAGLARAPLSRLVADGAEFDHDRVSHLLWAMVDESRPIKPEKLGIIGREHIADRLEAMGGDPDSIQYKLAKGITTEGRPWVLEVAFAWRPDAGRRIITGVNWSPGIEEPFRQLGAWLGNRYCGDARDPVVVFAHLATPRPHYTDRGKSTIVLDQQIRGALVEAIHAVTKRWTKQRRAEIRNASAELRRRDKLTRQHERKISIKDAFWQVLPEAYAAASSNGKFPALARQIYYAARPKILDLTEKTTLDAGYLSYTLLPQFMMENPELTCAWRVHFKARGNLTEPHTRIKIPLGTKEVGDYRKIWSNGAYPTSYSIKPWSPSTIGPHNRFAAVLAIEKEGFAGILIEVGVGDKFDLAIIGNEGQSVEAELALADALGLPIFVLHDFDRTGLTIAENLRAGTWRHRYRNTFPVIDVGLRLHQVAGLEDERISAENLKSVGDERLRECGATEDEIAFLRARRVELNALTTEQLVELVETALAEHGVQKVIPAVDDLAAAWRSAKAHAEIAEAVAKANKRAARWQKAPPPTDLADRVRDLLERQPMMSWDAALRRVAGRAP